MFKENTSNFKTLATDFFFFFEFLNTMMAKK